ncbi:hypothetical protein B0H65DRAFT_544493 [Neurospora tetraspora]|uniref:Uncharacterized protein n=1 Tax=Neurospora tetraspora TaxID=94610 RepID=A0AAE0MWR7_9PEZI|nr:hypothetical protein B0H65DRAFT_544493 [Neurospora tetraspora]
MDYNQWTQMFLRQIHISFTRDFWPGVPLAFQARVLVLWQLASGVSRNAPRMEQRHLRYRSPMGSMPYFFHDAIVWELEDCLWLH